MILESSAGPVFVCGYCELPIMHARDGVAILVGDPASFRRVLHAHLGSCLDILRARPMGADYPAVGLVEHVGALVRNSGIALEQLRADGNH